MNLYDPRAMSDRCINQTNLNELSSKLSQCLPASNYFLFYDIDSHCTTEIDTFCAEVPVPVADLSSDYDAQIFNDTYNISTPEFKEMMNIYAENESISIEQVISIETNTRGQSLNQHWKELKQSKLTASNFGRAAKATRQTTQKDHVPQGH